MERNEAYFDLAARRSARVVAWKPALIGATDLARVKRNGGNEVSKSGKGMEMELAH
jgi:hypothetical protein